MHEGNLELNFPHVIHEGLSLITQSSEREPSRLTQFEIRDSCDEPVYHIVLFIYACGSQFLHIMYVLYCSYSFYSCADRIITDQNWEILVFAVKTTI